MEAGGQRYVPAALPPERLDTHCIGGWVALRASLDRSEKSRSNRIFEPQTLEPLTSRYTDCAIPVFTITTHKISN
jgi:hypothetical protein